MQPLRACKAVSLVYAVVQRILNVEYSFPPQIKASDECKDLLERILVADPAKRMGIPQIMQHPWSVLPLLPLLLLLLLLPNYTPACLLCCLPARDKKTYQYGISTQ